MFRIEFRAGKGGLRSAALAVTGLMEHFKLKAETRETVQQD